MGAGVYYSKKNNGIESGISNRNRQDRRQMEMKM